MLQEIAITEDMAPIEVSQSEMEHLKQLHGHSVAIEVNEGQYFVYLRKGASLYIPKALRFDRFVAGQLPTGWDPKRYGIPEDIIQQVDRTTLFSLIATMEALVSSGITDPYEFYEYVHVSEIGNTVGGGLGGAISLRKMFRVCL